MVNRACLFQSVLMIGTQRSGSNLLRLILNQVPTVAAPHPPHILQRLMPLQWAYGNLRNQAAFMQLVDDVCRLVELNPVPWENVNLDRAEIMARCRGNSLVAIFAAIYDTCAKAWNADTWCCKSLANVHYFSEINDYLPYVKYLYLYRDGRDVAVSFKKAVVGQKHFYHIAQEWGKAQRAALKIREQVSHEQFLAFSYEELTTNSQLILGNLCDFLNVEYNPSMLDFHQSNEALTTASSSSLWSNVTNQMMKKNSKKFLTQATEEEVRIFELVAGDVLDSLGYERVQTAVGETANFREEEIAQFDRENQERKALVRETMDAEDRERRERQLALLGTIEKRHLSVGVVSAA